ncbi:transporter [Nesidiocoris tenuis]|uniref:Transporter n=1 Tax=Nesidiocoris tenuis TaxID=355587 RepID=A0ABN7AWQ0_9HEMI|nr:transporter [Nesidiocoris tenuis]
MHNDLTFTPIAVDRGGWSNKLDFLFSCISLSVGLGNVWRFPYLCYKNGGGAFLVTYSIAMFLCGIPIFFQEVAVGQYLGVGGSTFVGQLCPIFQGVGYATMTIVFFLDLYYCVIIAWGLFYLLSSALWFPELPWSSCGNWWNTRNCYEDGVNVTVTGRIGNHPGSTPIEEFWEHRVLRQSDGITDIGGMQWELLVCLFFGWLIVYSVIYRGLHQSGKVIWFTALFPYAVLLILLVRSVTLPGASDGLWYYITPRWEELANPGPWIDGASQIFFAYSIGTGALPALGSYNSFNHNCYKDAVITCVVNTLTSLLAGVCTFAVLGNIALEQNTSVDMVVNSGPGLVFLTYPEVVLKLPGATMWAVIFFLMLITLGVDSEFCLVESFVTGMVDKWPKVLLPQRRRFTFAVCLLLFILGIPMVTHGGIYIFQLMDYYSASGLCLLWVCFFQTIAISWFFGADRVLDCIQEMMGTRPNRFWYICWVYISPAVMLSIFVFNLIQYVPATYGSYAYPPWAQHLGISISLTSMLWIPGYALFYFLTTPGTFQQRLKTGLTPKINFRPNQTQAATTSKGLPLSESSVVLLTQSNSFVVPM